MASLKALDVVALLRDRPDLGIRQGWVGTLLLELAPGTWEVEFSDGDGKTVASAALPVADLLALQMTPTPAGV